MTGINFGGPGMVNFSINVNGVSSQSISANIPTDSSMSWPFTFQLIS